ncbi:kit ligand [Microcaecilia unicolor]|uniref:Kit ligand n=1 Tax=Microcaecilia unicolor TaxID=1415580 RepID=A0A6P7Z0V4_9AMPH|nr:kit ligand [Microcaecilia unicolor]
MKKTKTWIFISIYLQLLLFVHFGNPCGNPVTNAVNDIDKLVGNIPNDYLIKLKYAQEMPTLPNHCWLYLMVHEVSKSLNVLLYKFSSTSPNYSIISSLTMILQGIRKCLQNQLHDQMEFIEDYPYYKEGSIIPREFFRNVTRTIDIFKDTNNVHYDSMCIVPTTTVIPQTDSKIGVTYSYSSVPFPYLPSKRKENSSSHQSLQNDDSPYTSNLPAVSMAFISLPSLIVGFVLGIACWRLKHQKPRLEDVEAVHCTETKEVLELNSMLHQAGKEADCV